MNLDELQKKLERGYQGMLTQIEELVTKEGKSVKEAVEHAEQKISDWGELSKEEVAKVRDEVEHDLGSLGEALNQAKEVFKNQAKLDTRYLTSSAWDKLSQIADKSTLQLIQFKEGLQEQVQEIIGTTSERAHQDHRRWQSEHELWLEEIQRWQKQHDEAVARLEEIQQGIHKHAEALAEHAQAIQAHDIQDQAHERLIADREKASDSSNDRSLDDEEQSQHEAAERLHEQHAKFHLQIKQKHQKIMGLIDRLYHICSPT